MTLTDIVNLAMEDLSERAISSIDDKDDDLALRMKRQIFRAIREVQTMHRWSSITERATLVKCDTLPSGESVFIQPSGFAGIVECFPNVRCTIEGKHIIAPVSELYIKYARKSFNPDDWDDNLQGAIISKFRANVALNLSGDSKIAQLTYQQAQIEIPRYIRNDVYRRKTCNAPSGPSFFDGW